MRTLLPTVGALLLGVVAFFAVVLLASESGEVVTLYTRDEGAQKTTRLWVVDHAGAEWVRTGHADKGWFRRIGADDAVELERDGLRSPRTAVPVRDAETGRAVNEA
ncbi:MAG: hypothetical protein HKP30_09950, partial [Myxococcales bacterium]|nr:hypothetical protein [Myxococcales bacterium]